MMLSEVDRFGVTPSSDLLVEPAAIFDVLSIGIPTSTTGDGHHIRRGLGIGSTTSVELHR
jgi:hypothetical protein